MSDRETVRPNNAAALNLPGVAAPRKGTEPF